MKKFPIVKRDCKHFLGDMPCKPYKEHGVHCESCCYYNPVDIRISIIKLGAMGDVMRTTSILPKLWEKFPKSEIWWLTNTPEVISTNVNIILKNNSGNINVINQTHFDIVYNLDKDKEACSLLNSVKSNKKFGFCLHEGKTSPYNELANHKYLTGIFDDISKANKKSYQQEIYEICGFNYDGQEYEINRIDKSHFWDLDHSRKIIGLNTGCGDRWKSRLWKNDYWVELIQLLKEDGNNVILLGGKKENEKNLEIARQSGAKYYGYFTVEKFISLVNECNLVVTTVTLAMHIAIGLKKTVILLNNIFNPYEFELYGRGEIIKPSVMCKCYYQPYCTENVQCMDYIDPMEVYRICKKWINRT